MGYNHIMKYFLALLLSFILFFTIIHFTQ